MPINTSKVIVRINLFISFYLLIIPKISMCQNSESNKVHLNRQEVIIERAKKLSRAKKKMLQILKVI